jgi:uncharacterized protein (DUF1778 family)
MKAKKKAPPPAEKNIRIRFKDADQVAMIRKAAERGGLSFNRFVIEVSERVATSLLSTKPQDPLQLINDAVHESLTRKV